MRHITGKHIQKLRDGSIIYPDHDEFFERCRLKPIHEYIKHRRSTLKNYLEANKKDLLEYVFKIRPQPKTSNKILWWRKSWIYKKDGIEEVEETFDVFILSKIW